MRGARLGAPHRAVLLLEGQAARGGEASPPSSSVGSRIGGVKKPSSVATPRDWADQDRHRGEGEAEPEPLRLCCDHD
jgi:hypothetical protein